MTAASRTLQRIASSSIRNCLRTSTLSSLPRTQSAFRPRLQHISPTTTIPTIRSYSSDAPSTNQGLTPPDYLDAAEKEIFVMLAEQLEPTRLEVQDVSGGCGSMYAVEIASPKFKGLNMIKQHRLVQGILAEKIKGWHGLQLKTKAE